MILNLGKSQGVKEGMPFVIYQDDVEVGTVKVVLARDLVSAAQVEKHQAERGAEGGRPGGGADASAVDRSEEEF